MWRCEGHYSGQKVLPRLPRVTAALLCPGRAVEKLIKVGVSDASSLGEGEAEGHCRLSGPCG